MLQWFRTRARILASGVLLALVGLGGLSSAAHGGECHEDECRLVALRHDASSHAIGAADAAADHALHCILCHWTRSMRPSPESGHQFARPLAGSLCRNHDVLGAPSRIQTAQPSLRAPPSSTNA